MDGVHEGLDGVIVTSTRLSHVDGERGQLIVAGRDIEELSANADFETACALVWSAAGAATSPNDVREQLAEARVRSRVCLRWAMRSRCRMAWTRYALRSRICRVIPVAQT